jgi:hypothetical protein
MQGFLRSFSQNLVVFPDASQRTPLSKLAFRNAEGGDEIGVAGCVRDDGGVVGGRQVQADADVAGAPGLGREGGQVPGAH